MARWVSRVEDRGKATNTEIVIMNEADSDAAQMDVSLSERQRARSPIAYEIAQRKFDALGARGKPPPQEVGMALNRAEKTWRTSKRIRLILQAADAWMAPWAAVSACRRGCHHCCSQPSIIITSAEAQLLAQQSGQVMQDPGSRGEPIRGLATAEGLSQIEAWARGNEYVDMSCPFLRSGECSVYEHRPLVCRTHLSLDDIPLLCERVPGQPAYLPLVNAKAMWVASIGLQLDETMADIRDFFQPGHASG